MASNDQDTSTRNVLVLSAHETQLDRRIAAEVNTLVASGRRVTLVSVPTEIPRGCLDDRVRLIVPQLRSAVKTSWRKRLAKHLPRPLYNVVRFVWLRCLAQAGSDGLYVDYFDQLTPPEPFDVIHCHDLSTLPAAVQLRQRRQSSARIVYDSHELFPFQLNNKAFQKKWLALEQQYIGAAATVITVNESIAAEMARLYGVQPPVVIYNSYGLTCDARPLSEPEFLAHFGAAAGGFKILFQGSLTADRNLTQLVDAVGKLGEPVKLFLLGTGPFEGALRRRCQSKRLANVFFGPWVEQDQLLRYVGRADMGIIPYLGAESLNNKFCTPNKLFEYIEAGVPICASDLPELRRIVKDSGIGEVYGMTSSADLARAIDDCRRRVAAGAFTPASMQAAREKFSWARQSRTLLGVYDRLGPAGEHG
jgi:glycosyltransferase involved in cell wall biosynthesis